MPNEHDKLVERILTPPFDPDAPAEHKPASFDVFTGLAQDLREESDEILEKRNEQAPHLFGK